MAIFTVSIMLWAGWIFLVLYAKRRRLVLRESYGPYATWIKVPYEDIEIDDNGVAHPVVRKRWELHLDPDLEVGIQEVEDFLKENKA